LDRRTRRGPRAMDRDTEDRDVETEDRDRPGDYPAGGVVPILCDAVMAVSGWVSDRTGLPRLSRRTYGRWFAFGLENGLLFLAVYLVSGADLTVALQAGVWLRRAVWAAFFL